MHAVESRIQGIARVVVLVALDSPVVHLSVVSCQCQLQWLQSPCCQSGSAIARSAARRAGWRDECRGLDRSTADHFRGGQAFAREVAELAACFACDDDSRGDVVLLLAEEDRGLKAIGGDERLLAAGAAQVAKPAGKRSWIDGAEGVGADADVILIVKTRGVSSPESLVRRARRPRL